MLTRFSLVLAVCAVLGAAPRTNPLIDAVRHGDKQAVAGFLKDKTVDVNAAAPDGTTALHWAIDRDDAEAVALLIKAGAKVGAANRYGVMPLSLAAERGDAVVVSQLLDAGADPNSSMPEGETVLMTAARTGKVDALKALLVHGAKVDARDSSRGETALMWAAGRNNVEAIRMLIEFGADRNARTKNPERQSGGGAAGLNRSRREPTSFSAFLFAVRAGHIGAATALLDAGVDVNDKLSDGETALILACANGHWELASLLLDRGADPNLAEPGWNALHQLVRERRPNVGFGTPGPIETGTVDSIDLLRKMIAKGANVNARMSKDGMKDGQRNRLNRLGATAFLLAAKNTDVEAMKVLLAAGADPGIDTADHVTPLMVAAGVMIWNPGEDGGSLQTQEAEQLEAVKICLEQGNDINAKDIFGDTPLHGASYRGANSIVEILVKAGAKLDARDIRGWTPLTIANGIQYDCFYKLQADTAELLKKYMRAAGLSTEGQVTDGTECLDCFSTHPEVARAYSQRVNKQEAEWAARP
jgi:ankyrin repeat protein